MSFEPDDLHKKDYRVEIKIKNNLLWTAITQAGYKNVRQFSEINGLADTAVGNYLNLKVAPILKNGQWSKNALRMAEVLRCMPEDLFPPQHLTEALEKNTAAVEMNHAEMVQLPSGIVEKLTDGRTPETKIEDDELKIALNESIAGLPPRTASMIRARFGLDTGHKTTLVDLGEEWDISRERVNQIIQKGLRQLQHSKRPLREQVIHPSTAGLAL